MLLVIPLTDVRLSARLRLNANGITMCDGICPVIANISYLMMLVFRSHCFHFDKSGFVMRVLAEIAGGIILCMYVCVCGGGVID